MMILVGNMLMDAGILHEVIDELNTALAYERLTSAVVIAGALNILKRNQHGHLRY